MGLLRLLLEISVLASHSGQILFFQFPVGSTAVRIFFMISGFYMALILDKKYLRLTNGYRLFITNRFLRLYPIYWIVLLLTLAVCAAAYFGFRQPYLLKAFATERDHPSLWGWGVIVFSNLFIFLQAALNFVSFQDGNSFVIGKEGAVPGWHFLLVPQAWSIGLELSFYAVSPFFVKRSWQFVAGFAIGCYGLMYVLHLVEGQVGYFGPWGQRFFPAGLIYFLAGVVAYKLYERHFKKYYTKPFASALLVVWIGVTSFYVYMPDPEGTGYLFYCFLSFVTIPFVFALSNKWKWDRFIGELSYPAYLSHYVCIGMVAFVLKRFPDSSPWLGELSLLVTMAVSLAMLRFISIPIDRIREERVLRSERALAESERLDNSMAQSGDLKGVTNADKQV
ncbi:MAG TPA: acyltransferase [Chitinophagales bacterium]|nr:acyltransferase [Chitinophagales bacterium]